MGEFPELTEAMTARDHLNSPPDLPDAAEAGVLVQYHTTGKRWGNMHNTLDFSQHGPEGKLIALRCHRWGWLRGRLWNRIGPLTPSGNMALYQYFTAAAQRGDATAARRLQDLFPLSPEQEKMVAAILLEAHRRDAEQARRAAFRRFLLHDLDDLAGRPEGRRAIEIRNDLTLLAVELGNEASPTSPKASRLHETIAALRAELLDLEPVLHDLLSQPTVAAE